MWCIVNCFKHWWLSTQRCHVACSTVDIFCEQLPGASEKTLFFPVSFARNDGSTQRHKHHLFFKRVPVLHGFATDGDIDELAFGWPAQVLLQCGHGNSELRAGWLPASRPASTLRSGVAPAAGLNSTQYRHGLNNWCDGRSHTEMPAAILWKDLWILWSLDSFTSSVYHFGGCLVVLSILISTMFINRNNRKVGIWAKTGLWDTLLGLSFFLMCFLVWVWFNCLRKMPGYCSA